MTESGEVSSSWVDQLEEEMRNLAHMHQKSFRKEEDEE